MNTKLHWDTVYQTKASIDVSWYRPHLETSLAFIERAAADRNAAIIDIGGGESTLVDDLLQQGYKDISVLDISQAAIDGTRERLGMIAEQAKWMVADITQASLSEQRYDLWHDRAVFHFLTTDAARNAYVQQVTRSMKTGGHIIMATFALDGPQKCSGLEVVRYDAASLQCVFGPCFELIESKTELHQTPFGTTQSFIYCYFKFQTL